MHTKPLTVVSLTYFIVQYREEDPDRNVIWWPTTTIRSRREHAVAAVRREKVRIGRLWAGRPSARKMPGELDYVIPWQPGYRRLWRIIPVDLPAQ